MIQTAFTASQGILPIHLREIIGKKAVFISPKNSGFQFSPFLKLSRHFILLFALKIAVFPLSDALTAFSLTFGVFHRFNAFMA